MDVNMKSIVHGLSGRGPPFLTAGLDHFQHGLIHCIYIRMWQMWKYDVCYWSLDNTYSECGSLISLHL